MLDKYFEEARLQEDFSEIQAIGMDKTSRAKHHKYISLFVDLEKKKDNLCNRRERT